MPVMDGLQATRIIRSYEETGNWDAAAEAGIDQPMHAQDSPLNFHDPSKRIPIIAVSTCYCKLRVSTMNYIAMLASDHCYLYMMNQICIFPLKEIVKDLMQPMQKIKLMIEVPIYITYAITPPHIRALSSKSRVRNLDDT